MVNVVYNELMQAFMYVPIGKPGMCLLSHGRLYRVYRDVHD